MYMYMSLGVWGGSYTHMYESIICTHTHILSVAVPKYACKYM